MSPTIASATTYEEIQTLDKVIQPMVNLVNRGDGYFYGLSGWSEENQGGYIYRVAPGQNSEVLFALDESDDASATNQTGTGTSCPLIAGPDGAFYGGTTYGGAFAAGTIFRWSPDGVFSVLHDVNPVTEGYRVQRLAATPSGDLVGVMSDGGPLGGGTIFRLSLDGSFQTVHAFEAPSGYPPGVPVPPDAKYPPSSPTHVAIGSDGRIYGTTSIGGPIEAGFFSRFTYGNFFRLEDNGDITVLSEFHPFRDKISWLEVTPDGFIGNTQNSLIKIGLNGALSVEADFRFLDLGYVYLWTPLYTSHGIYGVSPSGGPEGGGFIYRTIPGGGTSIVQTFPADHRPYHPALVEGNDGLAHGLLDFDSSENPPYPRLFRLHESTTSPNFVPVAAPDEAWLPRKAKNGQREVVIDILANDQDADSDPLTIAHINGEGAGHIELLETPQGVKLRFTTQEENPPSRMLTYMVTDSRGGLSKGYVAIQSPVKDRFTGLATGGSVSNAPLDLKIDKDNEIKATFELNGKKYKGTGLLDAGDTASLSLSSRDETSLNLHLELQRGTTASIEATIRNGEADYHATCTASGSN
ncbi:choice-of-anchor tandem repeat GloVer-containing protein [Luteolibacter soli]|uniref:Choice-of-anchor tandem repeat GloVer-containing protein n=1 Tax=Luteolibacter soli TaxID=3135280 RepID=A0ABU9AS02_9BACT